MHGAPSVIYPVGRSRFAGVALLMAWTAGAAGLLAWRVQVDARAFTVFVASAAVLLPGVAALWGWLRSPTGTLAWDGTGWTWTAGPATSEAGVPEVVLDFQRWILVRWSGEGSRWLWLERTDRAPWASLRRAVYSRARPGTQRSVPKGEAPP